MTVALESQAGVNDAVDDAHRVGSPNAGLSV
jgi:hypothetical protein